MNFLAIVPENLTFSSTLGLIVSILALLLIVICISSMIYFYVNRNEKIIKKSSPVFCQLILFGIIMVNSSLIIWTLTQTQVTCIVKLWVLCLGFALIMGNLLAKTYRIFKIFTNIKVSTAAITDIDLLKFSGVVIFFEAALLAIYTFGSGTLPEAIVINSSTNSLYAFVSCQVPNNETFQTTMTIVIIAFNIILVLLGAVIAYLTRNVDSAFNESTWIGATMYAYIFLSVIFLSLYYTNGDGSGSAGAQYAERSFAILLGMLLTLGFLFGPKFMTIARIYFSTTNGTNSGGISGVIDSSRITDVSSMSMTDMSATGTEFIGAGMVVRVAKANEPPPRFLTSAIWAARKEKEQGMVGGQTSSEVGVYATSSGVGETSGLKKRNKKIAALGILAQFDEEFSDLEDEEAEDDEKNGVSGASLSKDSTVGSNTSSSDVPSEEISSYTRTSIMTGTTEDMMTENSATENSTRSESSTSTSDVLTHSERGER